MFTFIAPSFFLRLRVYPGCSYVLMQSKFLDNSVILRVTFIISLRLEVATNWHCFSAKVNDMSLTTNMYTTNEPFFEFTFYTLWILVAICDIERMSISIHFSPTKIWGLLVLLGSNASPGSTNSNKHVAAWICWVDKSDGLVMIKKD